MRTIGSDLISSGAVALVELVKNSYDADARHVIVVFDGTVVVPTDEREPFLDQLSGSICVLDDGTGMDAEIIEKHWAVIATAHRIRGSVTPVFQRNVLGEKGIGRFAAAKLGERMSLTSKCASEDEVSLTVDWRSFDADSQFLDEVSVDLREGGASIGQVDSNDSLIWRNAGVDPPSTGTVIHITSLTEPWTEADLQYVRQTLSRLVSKRNVAADFRMVLVAPDPFSVSGEIGPPEFLEMPPYRLIADVAENGWAEVEVRVHGTVAKSRCFVGLEGIDPTDPPLPCGAFLADVRVWDRDAASIQDYGLDLKTNDFKRLLDKVAGVSVFRDGFRVLPYGEDGNDWLRLDSRRVNNPSLRVSNNQVFGEVFISAANNSNLRDQSNREGLMANGGFTSLREAMQTLLAELETLRRASRKGDAKERKNPFDAFDLSDIVTYVATRHGTDSVLVELVKNRSDAVRESARELSEWMFAMSGLAMLGQFVDDVIHDGNSGLGYLRDAVSAFDPAKDFATQRLDLQTRIDFIAGLFDKMAPFSGTKIGRPQNVDLRKVVRDAVAIVQPRLDRKAIKIEWDLPDAPMQTRVEPFAIQRILMNFVDNSIFWILHTRSANKRILIRVRRTETGSVIIEVHDSGPGFRPELGDTVFEPYVSSKPNGRGLGLAISLHLLITQFEGSAEITKSELGGGAIRATLSKHV
jgi:signal transduction histidine kinase